MNAIYVVGTCDTKVEELRYVSSTISAAGLQTILVDVSTKSFDSGADIRPEEVARHHKLGADAVFDQNDRGAAVTAMSEALTRFLESRKDIGGVIGLGGSGNTAIVTRAMQALPVGVPKIMVSTVASGNVAPYVGPTDICMMYSVTDVAGLNAISRLVLGNAANAIVGMTKNTIVHQDNSKPGIGMTMFGVTTTCIVNLRKLLDENYECYVFHATGTGGRSMEKLVDSGLLSGVIDITTTEVADFLVGGVFPCTDDRFGAISRSRIPYVGSCGALDMVNFGAPETVPDQFRDRKLYVHNAQVTLMRTTPEENARFGEWIAKRLNRCEGPVAFLIPEKGVSAIDAPGASFYDPDADRALFDALESTWQSTVDRRLIRLPYHINDPEFAAAAIAEFRNISS
jgi:uncharacterized protein (UPF0261 family)